ncbi:MAG: HlyD family secretion protein [Bacteroidetes bacterium]|nr:HlyD family secretion protein [Bacteroidota bacterium]
MENNNNTQTQAQAETKHHANGKTGEEGRKPANKKKRLMILGIIATVIIVIVSTIWITSMGHESTDNAQLDATITPVRAVVQGFVTEVRFTDNQQVKKGDTLIVIDRKDYVAKLAQAQAALESAKAQLEIAKSGASSAESNATASVLNSQAAKDNITTAQARLTKAEKEMTRVDKMLKDGAATQQQFDATKAEYETAKAQHDMIVKQFEASSSQATGAQSQAEAQKSQIILATAMVKQREAELALAQNQYNNTAVLAPFDGIISKKSIEVGQYLQVSAPVCSAVDINNLYVSANFKETQIEEMRPGQEVEIKVDAFPKAFVKGTLQSFGGATGAKFSLLPPDNATGNFVKITQRVPVRIAITEYPKELAGMLLPGLSAVVDIKTK